MNTPASAVSEVKKLLNKAHTEKLFTSGIIGIVDLSDSANGLLKNYVSVNATKDTVFDVASITKSIPTSCLALKFIESGELSLEDPVKKLLPRLSMSGANRVKVWHLLTHTLYFSFAMSSLKDLSPEEILDRLFTSDFAEPPGKKNYFSNGTSILLGLLLEKLTGEKLPKLAEEIFFAPLKMSRTTFTPLELIREGNLKLDDIVPTEEQAWRGRLVQGEVHDESAYVLQKIMTTGSAGLFSTASDLLKFSAALLQGRANILNTDTIESIYKSRYANPAQGYGLGWQILPDSIIGRANNGIIFGKTGFTGCLVAVDLNKKRAMVMLTNFTYPYRKERALINELRSQISENIFS